MNDRAMPGDVRRVCLATVGVLLIGLAIAFAAAPTLRGLFAELTRQYFLDQDLPCLAGYAACLALLATGPLPRWLGAWLVPFARRPARVAAGATLLAVAIAAAGGFLAFRGFALSRDEIMANFDADIFRSGRLVAPIAQEWQAFSTALSPTFMLPIPPEIGWVSAYLPGNAAFRALIGLVANPIWVGPILIGAAGAALFGIARRLWPERNGAVAVCMLLFGSSPQVLITGMTSYAMSIHLAVNLVWLLLLLRNSRVAHGAAMCIGFLGCGLHQLVFHPLFAAPFVWRLWRGGKPGLALGYAAVYALSVAFWISFWSLLLPPFGHEQSNNLGGLYFLNRVFILLSQFDRAGLAAMALNLARFVSWQQIFALPLALAAWRCMVRDEGIARPLLAGILLTCAAMFLLLPYQGYGWGYRYLHGLIGSLCLLGGYGWSALATGGDAARTRASAAAFALGTAVTVCVVLPLKLRQTVAFIAPYRDALAAIRLAPADIVIVDSTGMAFTDDLVRNDPFLRNTPKILSLSRLTDAQIGALCGRFRVALFDRAEAPRFAIPQTQETPPPAERVESKRALMTQLRCGVPL